MNSGYACAGSNVTTSKWFCLPAEGPWEVPGLAMMESARTPFFSGGPVSSLDNFGEAGGETIKND